MITAPKLSQGSRISRQFWRFLSASPLKVANEHQENNVRVVFNDIFTTFEFLGPKKTFSFHNSFLRDSSQGPLSVDPSSGQKLFTTASIIGQKPVHVEVPDEETVRIQWPDNEVSEYTRAFFDKHASVKSRKRGRYYEEDVVIWDGLHKNEDKFPIVDNLKHDYNDYLTKEEALRQVLQDLNRFGLSIIENIPAKSDQEHEDSPTVQQLGERIGYIKKTFYGTTFNVRSKPNAINIAYTDKLLPLHQDLLYYESPPGLQLLHFIKNQATGGENVFSDGFSAARHVKHIDTEAYLALLEVPINYHYDREGHRYFQGKPLIVENNSVADSHIYDEKTHFKDVNYSPPFQAPFDFGISTHQSSETTSETGAKDLGDRHIFEDFLRGFKLFEDYINSPQNKIKFKCEEGTCVIFDNRRVLHARDSFDANSGERWLKGCYLDRDTYLSKLRTSQD